MNPIFEYSDTLNNPYEAFFFDAQKNNFPVSPHWHYFMEILYILKGTAYIETDTDNYWSGSHYGHVRCDDGTAQTTGTG